MRDRNRFEHELSHLGLYEQTPLAPRKWPRVMFEYDVHFGFLDSVDEQLQQQSPWGGLLTTHTKEKDFFDVKRDLNRLEIGTDDFALSPKGLAKIAKVKGNIKAFTDQLEKGCRGAKERKKVKGLDGRPRPFLLPEANADTQGLLIIKLPSRTAFPTRCNAWASPQAHITIPLSSVGALVAEIKNSIGKPAGKALTGASPLRMGLRSDHLFKAKQGVDDLRAAMITWKHKLSDGTLVDGTTFSAQLTGFLILQASYLWVSKLAEKADYEFYGKGHLPINVKTPFPVIYSQLLTPTEQLIYKELFAGATIRYRMFGLVEDSPTLALGANKVFPPVVEEDYTWDDLLDWTLGVKDVPVPAGGKVWPLKKSYPRVTLELRRIGFQGLDAGKWATLMDTIVALTQKLQ